MNKKDRKKIIELLNVHYNHYLDFVRSNRAEKAAEQYVYYHGMKTAYSNLLLNNNEYIEREPDGLHEIKKLAYDFGDTERIENNYKKAVL